MKRKRGSKIFTAFLGLSIVLFSTWGAIAPLLVYALPPALLKAKTIAELVLTLFAGSGTAVTSTPVLQSIYAYDTSYYSMESMIQNDVLVPVDTTLTKEEAIAALGTANNHSSPFNLDADAFREYVISNWQGMRDYGVDTVLRFQELANTDSVYGAIDNLGQIVKNVANYGYLGASNTIAMVANPGSVAIVTFGEILDSIKSVFGSFIDQGVKLESINSPAGYVCLGFGYNQWSAYPNHQNTYTGFYSPDKTLPIAFYGNMQNGSYGQIGAVIYNYTDSRIRVADHIVNRGGDSWTYPYIEPGEIKPYGGAGNRRWITIPGSPLFATRDEAIAYLEQFKNGTIDIPQYDSTSPDVINQDQGNITDLDNVTPAVTEGNIIEPVDSADYRNFVDDTAPNKGVTNAPIMEDFIDPYISQVPDYNEPWENPEIPATNDIIPVQPTFPDKPAVTDADKEEALLTSVEGITSVFPFCIPWDLLAFVRGLEVEREAPVIEWNFKIDRFGIDYTFVIDLSDFEPVADILRKLELILFIIGLAVKSRELIGA